MTPNNGIRKAAILIACLDQASADSMLDRMDPAQARAVRDAVMDLEPIGEAEQRRVMEEFLGLAPAAPAMPPAGIELDGQLAEQFAARRPTAASAPASQEPAFRFLREAEADKLARALVAERPQTIALVLAHLPSEQAGNVLVRLAPSLQAEVIRRLVELEETDPETLREVERGLLARLSAQVSIQRRRVAGLSAVKGIVDRSQADVSVQILRNLAGHDRGLADRLGRRPVAFDDLLHMDGAALAELLAATDPDVLMLALVGALPALVDRVLTRMPSAKADALRRRLEQLGPTRLSDVEEARRRIVELAEDLAVRGQIGLPRHAAPLRRAA